MAYYKTVSWDEVNSLGSGMPSPDQTRLYNMMNRSNASGDDNFFQKRAKSIENALGTTAAAAISGIDVGIEDRENADRGKRFDQSMKDIYKNAGFNNADDYYNAKEAAERDAFNKIGFDIDSYWNQRADADIAGDKNKIAELDNSYKAAKANLTGEDAANIARFDEVQNSLKNQSTANANEQREAQRNWEDYRKNSYIGEKTNQDRGKFAGSAINTLSTAFDVMAPGAGVLANSVQGGIEGIADELEQNGLENFNWERAGQNALTGATVGAVTGGLNKGISNQLAKNGGNLFKGGNAITRGLNNLGSSTTAGRIGSTLATGAARGAVSGAVGGATGAGLSAALNGQDVLGSAIQGAQQGFGQGALAGGIMAGANMAANATPGVGNVMRQLNEAGDNWKNSGDTFNERLTNTLTSGDSPVGEWLQGNTRSRALQRAGMIGNSIQDVSKTLNSLNPTGTVNTEYDPTFRATAPLGNDMTTYAKTAGISPDQEVTVYRGVPVNASDAINPGDYITTNRQLAQDYAGNGKVIEQRVPASSILDSVSEPLGEEYIYRPGQQLMYHTTNPNVPFNEAGPDNGMIWVTPDKKYSASFAQNGDQTYDVYADIKNPASIGSIDGSINPGSIKALSDATGISESDLMNIAKKQDTVHLFGITNSRDFRDMLKNRGFDGIEALEAGGRVKTYAAFDPNQIRSANGSPNISSTTPKTVGEWLKQAGKRIVEDANNRGVGMSIKNVADEQTIPQDIQNMRINNPYETETEAVKMPQEQATIQGPNKRVVTPAEAENTLKTSKSEQLRYKAAQELLKQYGTVDKPTAKATNAPKTIQEIADAGFTKPGDVERIADNITGSNGEVNKLVQNLVSTAKRVNTFDGLDGKTIDEFIDESIARNALDGINEGKAVKSQIKAYLNSLESRRSGSIDFADAPEDVMDVVRGLESEAANYEGRSGMNYGTTTQDKLNAAKVAKDVATLLKDRVFDTVDVKAAMTPEVADSLKALAPNNKQWSDYVDNKIMTAENLQDLRSVQAPFVRAKKIIDNGYLNSVTYGGRLGNAASGNIPTSRSGLVKDVINSTWNTNFANRMKAGALNKAADIVDRVGGNGGGNGGNGGNAIIPTNNGGNSMPNNVVETAYNPSTKVYEAIGRTEGLSNAEQARTADYLTQASQEMNATQGGNTLESMMAPSANTGSTSVYNSMYGGGNQTASTQSSGGAIVGASGNSYFPSTGDYWTDVLAKAMTSAIDADDVEAFASLYAMYQDAASKLSKSSSGKDYSDVTNWNTSDRTKLLGAQDAMSQIDQLEQAYNNATGGNGGNVLQGNLRSFASNISGGNLDPSANNYNKLAESVGMGIVKNLINLGVTEADAKRYLEYLPALTDTKDQAAQKLSTLRNIYQSQINNLYSAYGV